MALPPPFSPSMAAMGGNSPVMFPMAPAMPVMPAMPAFPAMPTLPVVGLGVMGGGASTNKSTAAAASLNGSMNGFSVNVSAAFAVIHQRQQWIMRQVQMHAAHRWQWQMAQMRQTAAEIVARKQ
jgi:hypothetical protein